MGKKRIFELAKHYGFTNRDLIDKLQKLGFEVKSHSSTIEEEDVAKALSRAEQERKASRTESRVSRKVIRRRPKGGVVRRRPGAQAEEPTSPEPQTTTVIRRRPAETAAKPEPPAQTTESKAPPSPPVETQAPTSQPAEVADKAPEAKEPAGQTTEVKTEATEPQATETTEATQTAEAQPQTAEVTAQETTEAADTQADPKTAETQAAADPATAAQEAPAEQAPAARTARVARPTNGAVGNGAAVAEQAEAKNDETSGDTQPKEEEGNAEKAKTARPEKRGSEKRREARTARPDRKREEAYDEDDEKPDVSDLGISEFDFSSENAERERSKKARVAPPPPSTTVKAKTEQAPQSKVLRRIDPAVLKARISQDSKRPEWPKELAKPEAPEAPSIKELVVVKNHDGKKKQLVDVRDGRRGNRPGLRRKDDQTAKELLEARRGQVFYPVQNRRRTKGKRAAKRAEPVQPLVKRTIQIGDTITVAELSQQMSQKAPKLIGWLMKNGVMANINQPIGHRTAAMLCADLGYEVESRVFQEEEMLSGNSLKEAKASHDESSEPRAPVVTVMGHVDHGKTSLLDRIRSTNVAAGEAGGITQRIAGYQVETKQGLVAFLDTPGHAAFSAMRARGANVTDIVVLVVAADDGVMPQTQEAINHARAADVPIVVALNKIDKPEANPDRVLKQLADTSVLVEAWGGDVPCQYISAKTGDGVDELLELLALQADVLELKADPTAPAVGTVVEGHVHKGRGSVATILVREGTLKVSDIVVVGEKVGKVRAMLTDGGTKVKEAGPSTPVEILGLDGVPNPGDEMRVAPSLEKARELAAHRRERRRATELAGKSTVSLQDFFNQINSADQKELKIVVKADQQGTVEAVSEQLSNLTTKKVKVSVISAGVGAVAESDVEFAKASEAIIVGFSVRPDTKALKAARAHDIDIRSYDVIYEAVDEVRLAMQGLLAPISKEKYLGRAEVRQTFNVPKIGTVAGCAVVDGNITRSANIRLLRDSKPIYDGKLSSLKRFKDDVREVREGLECGMGIEKFNDLKVGDIFEAYEIVMTEATLDEPTGGGQAASESRPRA